MLEKEKWLEQRLTTPACKAGADPAVLGFIADFLYAQGPENSEMIYRLFRSGYCWHFASMLKATFDRGTVVHVWPYSHMAWLDETTDIAYDIDGIVYNYTELVPTKDYGTVLNPFLHIPEKKCTLPLDEQLTAVDEIRKTMQLNQYSIRYARKEKS